MSENNEILGSGEREEGKEKEIFEIEKKMSRLELATLFYQLAEKIEEGELNLEYGSKSANLTIPTNIKMELEVEEKVTKGRTKRQLEIEIEWYEDEEEDDKLIIK